MLALDVCLDVVCCACETRLAVTVKCEGVGLQDGSDARAIARFDCPYCQQTNHVIFAPETGEVIEVMDRLRIVRRPVPSAN